MPKVKSKVSRHEWDEENMREAMINIQQKKMGWKLASKTFNVPASTLRRRVGKNMSHEKGNLGGCQPTFSNEIESEIVAHITNMETRFLGLTTTDVRSLAYQVAVQNNIQHKFSHLNNKAGWTWLHSFIKRNPLISLRTPENTSAARATAFNRGNIEAYFKSLDEVLTLYKFSHENIYNMDESGFSTVQTKPEKIYATKGRKQVGSLTSAERGLHYTAVCAMNAVGTFIPPAFIFPRKNMKPELMDNAPPGSVCFCQETGWMTSEVMVKWLDHFIRFAKPTLQHKVLLLLDGHASHKHLSVLTKAKENGIILFCFPAHCTHRCQPLDTGFFGPLQTFYNQQIRLWLKAHPGRVVTHLQVANIFGEAYLKAATPATAIKAFKTTGIVPYNPQIFEDWMFDPSETTNRTPAEENIKINSSLADTKNQPLLPLAHQEVTSAPSTSNQSPRSLQESNSEARSSKLSVSIEQISPLPKMPEVSTNTRKPRKKGKMGIINATPDIESAKSVENLKREKERAKLARAVKRKVKIVETSSDEENLQANYQQDEGDEDVPCLYCNELYSWSRSKELWLKCQICGKWAHGACADRSPKIKTFICELCEE